MSLRAVGVSHGYGDELVLEDLSLSIHPGEVVAIIGPSGVGKTTLLGLLALFEAPRAGRLECDGADVWALSERGRLEKRREIGLVFQSANLFDASVRRNAEYGRHVRRSWADRLGRTLASALRIRSETGPALEALSVVGMADAHDRNARSLSGGEAKRVAFARALAYDPSYLLLDEPTSDLDPQNTAAIEAAIEAATARGIGVAVATHDMHQARRIADRVALFLGPDRLEVGETETVFERPSDDRARRFVEGELLC